MDFSDSYKLKDGYTYSVTARIKPNEKAKEKYKNNKYSYPDTGEKGTGPTSEDKKGIFSNVENSAKVTWTTDGETKEGKYNRPVVQIPEKEIPVELKKEPVNFFLNLSSSFLILMEILADSWKVRLQLVFQDHFREMQIILKELVYQLIRI